MVVKIWDSTSKNEIINKTANTIDKKTVTTLFKVVQGADLNQQKSFYKQKHALTYRFISG